MSSEILGNFCFGCNTEISRGPIVTIEINSRPLPLARFLKTKQRLVVARLQFHSFRCASRHLRRIQKEDGASGWSKTVRELWG